jgi:hypothetical protein
MDKGKIKTFGEIKVIEKSEYFFKKIAKAGLWTSLRGHLIHDAQTSL